LVSDPDQPRLTCLSGRSLVEKADEQILSASLLEQLIQLGRANERKLGLPFQIVVSYCANFQSWRAARSRRMSSCSAL
jgi:hypothetical protein